MRASRVHLVRPQLLGIEGSARCAPAVGPQIESAGFEALGDRAVKQRIGCDLSLDPRTRRKFAPGFFRRRSRRRSRRRVIGAAHVTQDGDGYALAVAGVAQSTERRDMRRECPFGVCKQGGRACSRNSSSTRYRRSRSSTFLRHGGVILVNSTLLIFY